MKAESKSTLAEKIARLIEAESNQSDLASLFAGIEKLNHRLDKLESEWEPHHASLIAQHSLNHPSQDRFAVAEAIADALFDSKSKEKACTFEPNGKPCDHCAMCSSRGF